MQIALLVLALVFIAWDLLMGFFRGFFPALLRLGFIVLCFVGAYFLAAPLSGLLMEIPLPFFGGQTLHAAYEGYILGQGGLSEALSLAEAIEQLVLHFPDVLLSELNFITIFVLLRLLTLPLFIFLSRRLFGTVAKKREVQQKDATVESVQEEIDATVESVQEEIDATVVPVEEEVVASVAEESVVNPPQKPVRAGSFRSGGMVIGILQAVICFAVLLVPIFGVVEFGERFYESFADSEEVALVDIASDIEEGLVAPINQSFVTKMCETVGIRTVCVRVFHGLSETTLVLSHGERRIDYFDYLESMFPAVSALLKLTNVNPEEMSDKDYENVTIVLKTAKEYEDLAPALKKSVSDVVEEFVEESYRESAEVIVAGFSEKVVYEKENLTPEQLKQEVEAVKKTMKVIQCATNATASGAFSEVPAADLVDDIIQTTALYDTLIEASQDPAQRVTLSKDFASSDEDRANMKAEIDSYRAESVQNRTPEELERILALTDALAEILHLHLAPLA